MITMNRISDVAYKLYKQNWIDTNTSREMRLDNIRNWAETEIQNDDEDLVCTYEECRGKFGYAGRKLCICYNEFPDAEYQDR